MGADENQVFSDYLYTNEQTSREREKLCHTLAQWGTTESQLCQMRILESVDRAYLTAIFREIQHRYGSVKEFLSGELGLGPADQRRLRAQFWEEQ